MPNLNIVIPEKGAFPGRWTHEQGMDYKKKSFAEKIKQAYGEV